MTPEFRENPFGNPIIVAPARATRPHDVGDDTAGAMHGLPSYDPDCPFCPGNERETPPEVDAFRPQGGQADGPGWTVRVVPNKFPALGTQTTLGSGNGNGLFRRRPARGLHEVAIHTPDHAGKLGALQAPELQAALAMWQLRLVVHRDGGWAATTLVVNEGRAAGASLEHPHAQLFATDTVPPGLATELARQDAWLDQHGEPLIAAVVAAETDSERLVDTEGDLIAWTPFWASVPYETWIAAPSRDADTGSFADTPQLADLARLLTRVASRIGAAASHPALNLILVDPPHAGSSTTWWHLRLVPQTTVAAGFELATGVRIVPGAPEMAAAELRATM